jgi:DNA-binding transcriptional MerR regulator
VDADSGYRYYTAAQLPRVNRVLVLKDLGLSLDDIRSILEDELSPAELRGMLRLRRAEIGARVQEERARLERVESRLRVIEKEGSMPEREVVLKEMPSVRGLSLREVLPGVADFPGFIGDGFAALGMAGAQMTGPPFVVYHDPEFTGSDIDAEMVYPTTLPGPVATPTGRTLTERIVEGGPVASLVHVGEYHTIGEAYQALGTWLDEQGRRGAGPPREIYLTGPDEPGPPVTEIQMPLEAE